MLRRSALTNRGLALGLAPAIRLVTHSCFVLALCGWAAIACADDAKRVLILHSNQSVLPATVAADTAIRREMQSGTKARLEVFSEFLDKERFPEPEQDSRMATFLREKYAKLRIDLVIATGLPALDFLVQRRSSMFPDAPLLFVGVSEDDLKALNPPPDVAGVVSRLDPTPTIDLALRLQPDARQVVVVGGTTPAGKNWEAAARRVLPAYRSRLTARYLFGLPMAELLRDIAQLPSGTFVLYFSILRDGTGKPFIPRDVAEKLAAASSVPVYGQFDTYVGHGIVGGNMETFDGLGAQAGRLALRALAGEHPTAIPHREVASSTGIVDWRQLRRWGLSDSRLPPGTIVRFEEPSLWDQYKWAIVTAFAVLIAQSVLIVALVIQRRRRRRAESSLQESEDRINLAAVSARLGFWHWSIAADRVWATAIGWRMVSMNPPAPVSLARFLAAAHPEDRVATRRSFEQAATSEEPFDVEFRLLPPDGSTHWIKAIGRRASAIAGQPARLMGIIIDVTAEKVAELRFEEQRRDLTHLARVALLGELSGAVAHELNQPLTAILTNAQAAQRFLTQDFPDMTEVGEILADIVAEGKRAGEVIRHLRTLYRKGEAQLQPLDLNEVAREVLQLAHSDLIARKVSVTTRLAPELPPVRGDRVQLQQVLLNLIVNACDAMRVNEARERALTVATMPDGAGIVQVSVADRGPGIGVDMVDRLFQPFVTSKAQGLGLGLSICRSIVTAHGGRIWADNNPQRGATFSVALPADGGMRP